MVNRKHLKLLYPEALDELDALTKENIKLRRMEKVVNGFLEDKLSQKSEELLSFFDTRLDKSKLETVCDISFFRGEINIINELLRVLLERISDE